MSAGPSVLMSTDASVLLSPGVSGTTWSCASLELAKNCTLFQECIYPVRIVPNICITDWVTILPSLIFMSTAAVIIGAYLPPVLQSLPCVGIVGPKMLQIACRNGDISTFTEIMETYDEANVESDCHTFAM